MKNRKLGASGQRVRGVRRGPTTWQRVPMRDVESGEVKYTIRHMLTMSDVSERTFARWRAAGLIDKPAGIKRAALYGERQGHQALVLGNWPSKRLPTREQMLARLIEVMAGDRPRAIPIGRGCVLMVEESAELGDGRSAALTEAVIEAYRRIVRSR